jgi:hypothetical protein
MSRDMWPAFILMELIVSSPFKNSVIRNNQIYGGDCVSELGIYSCLIRSKAEVFSNRPLGHLLRTKFSDVKESGVSAGFGALDSPSLI